MRFILVQKRKSSAIGDMSPNLATMRHSMRRLERLSSCRAARANFSRERLETQAAAAEPTNTDRGRRPRAMAWSAAGPRMRVHRGSWAVVGPSAISVKRKLQSAKFIIAPLTKRGRRRL